jgi:hypothetical protein
VCAPLAMRSLAELVLCAAVAASSACLATAHARHVMAASFWRQTPNGLHACARMDIKVIVEREKCDLDGLSIMLYYCVIYAWVIQPEASSRIIVLM